jgi:nitroreductase
MTIKPRVAQQPVEPLFLERWSPRAFDSSAVPQGDLDTILEAASWAPSAFNYQPWRFAYAHRDGSHWQTYLDLLLPFNAAWAERAGVLIFILSDTLIHTSSNPDPSPSHSHSFDAGASWVLLALQATRLGYHAHGMTGVDFDKARRVLEVPERFRVEAAVAVGRRADKSILPEALQTREQPSDRRPLEDFSFEGGFPAQAA